jgi:hypothetical protein
VIFVNMSPWMAGIAAAQATLPGATTAAAREYADRVLEAAQSQVHVVTGNLRASGDADVKGSPTGAEVQVTFGGKIGIDDYVDYAGYEEDLHPFLQPAAEQSRQFGLDALNFAFEASV